MIYICLNIFRALLMAGLNRLLYKSLNTGWFTCAEIAPRSRRDRVENAPSAAHSRAAVRRLLGTCDQDGRHTFDRDELRDKIDAMLSKSVHSP